MGYFNDESLLSLPTADDLRLDLVDYADATASLLSEQRAAALDRCGITVAELELPILTPLDFDGPTAEGTHIQYAVYQDIDCVGLYDDDAAAYEYAYELASELIEQGDLERV